MTISYPLAMPTQPGFVDIRISKDTAVGISESPWTLTSQVQTYPGQRWRAEFSLPPMSRADSETWQCFLLQLDGQRGTFLMGDPFGATPRGTWRGSPKVNGAGQFGLSLNIKSLDVGATIEPGDYIQIGQRLYKNISSSTVTADGSGLATIDIWPRLRESYGDGDSIITESAKGLFRLADSSHELYNSTAMEYYSITLSAVEAI